MSRLKETPHGWQWDDSRFFPERDGAIEYGQFIIREEIEKEIEHLEEKLWHLRTTLDLLEKEAEKRRNST